MSARDELDRITAVEVVQVPKQAAFAVSDAAQYLGISPNTLRKRCDQGLIPAKRNENGHRVFLLFDLNNYLNHLPSYYQDDTSLASRPVGTGRKKKGGET